MTGVVRGLISSALEVKLESNIVDDVAVKRQQLGHEVIVERRG